MPTDLRHDDVLTDRADQPLPGVALTRTAPRVALAHDYLTQRGGAERVALIMADAFTGAPMYTTLYDRGGTFPEFAGRDIRTSQLNAFSALRTHHRLAMPLLSHAVDQMHVEADVLLASSSGWAHGISTSGRKIIYCHAPARWLYQPDRYLGTHAARSLSRRVRGAPAAALLSTVGPRLRRWDAAAAGTADRYLVNSTLTQRAVREVYGIDAEVLAPPPALLPHGPEQPVDGIEPGFALCVARLLPYKNVDVVIDAFSRISGLKLVVVGGGPELSALRSHAASRTPSAAVLGRVSDAQLRWLYRNSSLLVAASFEDYGLSPLEAAAFGRPSVVLRAGGYLDTVREGHSGTFFDAPRPELVADAVRYTAGQRWHPDVLRAHADTFSVARFTRRLHEIVATEAAAL